MPDVIDDAGAALWAADIRSELMMDRCLTSVPTTVRPLPELRRVNWLVLFLYRRWPHWFQPKRVCAWCDRLMARGGVFSRGKVSHGVCTGCAYTAMKLARENLPHIPEGESLSFSRKCPCCSGELSQPNRLGMSERPWWCGVCQKSFPTALLFFALTWLFMGCERVSAPPARYHAVRHEALAWPGEKSQIANSNSQGGSGPQ